MLRFDGFEGFVRGCGEKFSIACKPMTRNKALVWLQIGVQFSIECELTTKIMEPCFHQSFSFM